MFSRVTSTQAEPKTRAPAGQSCLAFKAPSGRHPQWLALPYAARKV
jgi:hypothetical protein